MSPRSGGLEPSPDCRRCERLASFLEALRERYPGYFCRPVPSFGPERPRLLVVGLAPGMHGANATGRPFTGDHAGILLYRTLYEAGFSSAAESIAADDGLTLRDCRITNAVRCLPPQNKPTGAEVRHCNGFLGAELARVPAGGVVLALGRVAHGAVVRALGLRQADLVFAHGVEHGLDGGLILLDSFHCSRYNTQTRRLTEAMFAEVMARARVLVDRTSP